jgi:hypothetical protein
MSFSSDVADHGIAEGEFEAYHLPYEDDDFQAMGIDPAMATEAKPGSEEKVQMLSARYAAGLPLWHDADCYDHGPARNVDEEEPVNLVALLSDDEDDDESA